MMPGAKMTTGLKQRKHTAGDKIQKRNKEGSSSNNTGNSTLKKRGGKDSALCPVSRKCGGCCYLGVPYEEQLDNKQSLVRKLLKPYCSVQQITGMEDPYNYRNKVHAVFGRKKDGTIISGTYEENTHRIVPVDSCRIDDPAADEIIMSIRELAASFRYLIYNEDSGYGLLRHVLVRTAHSTGQIMVVLVLSSPILPSKNNFVKALLKKHPQITTIILNVNPGRTSMILGDKESVLYGRGYIEDQLCGLTFRISSRSFYQVNPVQTEKLYVKAIELAKLTGTERVIDAYSGIGTIGLIASEHAKEVISVELNRDAVRDAVANAKANRIRNVQFYQADAAEFMQDMAQQSEYADVVLMDPPRSGSTEEFMAAAAALRPSRIVYISCNPETLARDLAVYQRLGYKAETAYPFDMFPLCDHVETLVLMSRIQG